jgi:hypothetical protein
VTVLGRRRGAPSSSTGTVGGAGGPFEIGTQAAGFAEIHFSDGTEARAVDLIEVEPLSGEARASRTVLGTGELD